MTKLSTIIFVFISSILHGQIIKDHYKITVDKYSFYPHYIFTDKHTDTFLPGDEKIIIKFPPRTDTVEYYDANGYSRKDTLTTTHFTLDRIIDTICLSHIDSFINSKIKIYYNNKVIKIDRIAVKVLYPDGSFYYDHFKSNTISFAKATVKAIKRTINNSYIVIPSIWFYDLKGHRQEINDEIGWKIKNCH